MTARIRQRLRWFKLFVDDLIAATAHFSDAEFGQYVRLLCAQWGSKERIGVVVADARGFVKSALSRRVLSKFDRVERDGEKLLRNGRLAKEWAEASRESAEKSQGRQRGHKRLRDPALDTTLVSSLDTTLETTSTRADARSRQKPEARSQRGEVRGGEGEGPLRSHEPPPGPDETRPAANGGNGTGQLVLPDADERRRRICEKLGRVATESLRLRDQHLDELRDVWLEVVPDARQKWRLNLHPSTADHDVLLSAERDLDDWLERLEQLDG